MIFISHQEETYFSIENDLDKLSNAFESLKQNYRFHHVLEVSLAISNFLNGSNSIKGGAWGFKLDSIERMEEVKSSDSQMNAAFCVIQEVWKQF